MEQASKLDPAGLIGHHHVTHRRSTAAGANHCARQRSACDKLGGAGDLGGVKGWPPLPPPPPPPPPTHTRARTPSSPMHHPSRVALSSGGSWVLAPLRFAGLASTFVHDISPRRPDIAMLVAAAAAPVLESTKKKIASAHSDLDNGSPRKSTPPTHPSSRRTAPTPPPPTL
ncbi:hypothetical protein ACCO45_010998 [Purpureocillium lilacinum]|uniref:Uncharacterized protein n=1 Tax=Purpureocillium lilacinum TaxID=33203 RepID=A0ACC4DGF9_PURLI